MTENHPDAAVPESEQLACLLWKCHHSAMYGLGDGSVTWNTLAPVERMWWIKTAENLTDSAWWQETVVSGNEETPCPECGQVGGPYPNGDRPSGNGAPMRSGCERCGWCY